MESPSAVEKKLKGAATDDKAASIAKSRFLSNISHDIRTPMNEITGFISLAMSCLDDKQQLRDYLIKASISSQHLLELINDIFDISSLEAGKVQLDEAPCLIDEIINDLHSVTATQAQAKQQTFDVEVDIADHAVICDRLRLNQILSNLLSNAVKFTPVGGRISLHVTQTFSRNGSGHYEFKVRDNGIGIDEEFLPKIFEVLECDPHFVVDAAHGTGLGMALTKRIVDLMGGDITVKSTLGKGSEFTVDLYLQLMEKQPAHREPINENEAEPGSLNFDGRRVLLAEDNELNCEIAKTILENYGFIVDTAEDGLIAVEKYKAAVDEPYDLILMDIQMPNLDGCAATRLIRDYEKSIGKEPVPIIALTANAFEEDRKAAISAGMNTHIAKPIDIPTLIRAIRKILI